MSGAGFYLAPCQNNRERQMTFEDLKEQIAAGQVDTVLVCIVDMQGRLMGKRFHAEAFLEMAEGETHCCNYLLATDLAMVTFVPHYGHKQGHIHTHDKYVCI